MHSTAALLNFVLQLTCSDSKYLDIWVLILLHAHAHTHVQMQEGTHKLHVKYIDTHKDYYIVFYTIWLYCPLLGITLCSPNSPSLSLYLSLSLPTSSLSHATIIIDLPEFDNHSPLTLTNGLFLRLKRWTISQQLLGANNPMRHGKRRRQNHFPSIYMYLYFFLKSNATHIALIWEKCLIIRVVKNERAAEIPKTYFSCSIKYGDKPYFVWKCEYFLFDTGI